MKGALEIAGLNPAKLILSMRMGPYGKTMMEVESKAMIRLFGKPPAFASTKSNTGHTLGAAGAVEAAYSILSLYYQEVYPAPSFSNTHQQHSLIPVTSYAQKPLAARDEQFIWFWW
jgi:3-oxoacyl-(acyl-carrier-protein) synthase